MLQIQIPLAALLFAAMLPPQQGVQSLVPSPTQETRQSSAIPQESALPSPSEQQRTQAEVAEIMAIRKQLGGGVSEALGDLSLKMPGSKAGQGTSDSKPPLNYDSEFAERLAKQSQLQATPVTQLQTASAQRLAEPESEPDSLAAGQLSPTVALERQESIRHAARMLEEAAAALEEAKVYDQADQIRQTAGELWRAAR